MLYNYIPMIQEALIAQAEGGGGSGSPFNPMFIIMIIAVMYFIMIRPQQKKDRERRDLLASLSKGDLVVTQGGIHGKIVGLDETKVVLKVSDDPVLKLEFVRSSIAFIVVDEK